MFDRDDPSLQELAERLKRAAQERDQLEADNQKLRGEIQALRKRAKELRDDIEGLERRRKANEEG